MREISLRKERFKGVSNPESKIKKKAERLMVYLRKTKEEREEETAGKMHRQEAIKDRVGKGGEKIKRDK